MFQHISWTVNSCCCGQLIYVKINICACIKDDAPLIHSLWCMYGAYIPDIRGRSKKINFSVSDTGGSEEKSEYSQSGIESVSFSGWLLIQMLYLWATGVSWELRPLNYMYCRFMWQMYWILLGLECQYVLMRNDRDVMMNFEPGEYMRTMIFQSVTQAA